MDKRTDSFVCACRICDLRENKFKKTTSNEYKIDKIKIVVVFAPLTFLCLKLEKKIEEEEEKNYTQRMELSRIRYLLNKTTRGFSFRVCDI